MDSNWRLERQLKRSQMRRELINIDKAFQRADEKLIQLRSKPDEKTTKEIPKQSKETIPRPSLALRSNYKSYFEIKTTSEKVKEVTPIVVENIDIKDQIKPIEVHSKEPRKESMSIQVNQVKDIEPETIPQKPVETKPLPIPNPKDTKKYIDLTEIKRMQLRQTELTGVARVLFSRTVDKNSMLNLAYTYKGEKDSHGMPHGHGEVIFNSGDVYKGRFKFGVRDGVGIFKTSRQLERYLNGALEEMSVEYIEACYTSDLLQGEGKINWKNGDFTLCTFSKSCLHGLARTFTYTNNLIYVCWYENGFPKGSMWVFSEGGGFIVGNLSDSGQLTGNKITFLYPDLKTCITGMFSRGRLVSAKASVVTDVLLKNRVYELTVEIIPGRSFSFEPGTCDKICDNPLLPDPYEQKYVIVKLSKKNYGEGLFTVEAVPSNTILAFYNGTKQSAGDLVRDDNWENDAYKILNSAGCSDKDETEAWVLDIPLEYRTLDKYCASLAHKANHSFVPNAKYTPFQHPRFGKVPSLITLRDLRAGEEIFVNYEYSFDEAPPWYTEAYSLKVLNSYKESQKGYGLNYR